MTAELSPEARAIIQEEETLLARVQDTLRAKRPNRERDDKELLERLKDLREEAAKAAAHDLPTLFQEMNLVRALLEHPQDQNIPDWRAPYFAHLKLDEDGVERDYCLGRASFVESKQGVRVVDWRFAPVARIFYRYREGDTYEEEFPGRTAEGTLVARRVIVIKDGVLTKVLAPGITLSREADGRWTEQGPGSTLTGGAGTAARAGALGVGYGATAKAGREADISAMLDREQFDVLSTAANHPLLVLGSAGSGKTTVALHRMATLAFEDKQKFAPERMGVVVPEKGLARLSAKLLAPLGLGGVPVKTLEEWAKERLRSAFDGGPAPKLCEDTPPALARLKRHPALYHVLKRKLLREQGKGPTGFVNIRRELSEIFTDRGLLETVVQSAKGDLPTPVIDEAVRHTMRQISAPMEKERRERKDGEERQRKSKQAEAERVGETDLPPAPEGREPMPMEREERDEERFTSIDGRSLSEGTPEEIAGTIDPEDVPLMLFLKAARAGLPGAKLAHLVVDEAEDLSLFELEVLGRILTNERSVTLAGDDAQQTHSSFAGWNEALTALGTPNARLCRLQVSYRCPKPIASFARQVLAHMAPEQANVYGRDGAPVGRFEFPAEAHASLFLVDAIRELMDREPHASLGVVCRSAESAQAFYRLVEDLPEARLVLDGEFSFLPGIDVTDVANVKGLEFDYVIVPDCSASAYPDTDEARRLLHVAVTRASHQLWVASSGTPSPILARIDRAA